MADNTRMKDLAAELKRLADAIEQRDLAYNSRFDRIESSIDSITRTIDLLSRNLERVSQSPAISEPNSSTARIDQPYQTIQVRNIKLDFPRFDGSEPLN